MGPLFWFFWVLGVVLHVWCGVMWGFGGMWGLVKVCIFHNQKMHVYLIFRKPWSLKISSFSIQPWFQHNLYTTIMTLTCYCERKSHPCVVLPTHYRNEVKGAGLQDTKENCWRFFIDRVRRQLKVSLLKNYETNGISQLLFCRLRIKKLVAVWYKL